MTDGRTGGAVFFFFSFFNRALRWRTGRPPYLVGAVLFLFLTPSAGGYTLFLDCVETEYCYASAAASPSIYANMLPRMTPRIPITQDGGESCRVLRESEQVAVAKRRWIRPILFINIINQIIYISR